MNKNTPAAKALGSVVTRYRERRGMKKQELAYEAELSVNTIKRLENGEYGIGLHVLFAVASALQLPASLLIKEAEAVLQKGT